MELEEIEDFGPDDLVGDIVDRVALLELAAEFFGAHLVLGGEEGDALIDLLAGGLDVLLFGDAAEEEGQLDPVLGAAAGEGIDLLLVLVDVLAVDAALLLVADDVVDDVAGFGLEDRFGELAGDAVQEGADQLVADAVALLLVELVLEIAPDPLAEGVHILGAVGAGEVVVDLGQDALLDLDDVDLVEGGFPGELGLGKIWRGK